MAILTKGTTFADGDQVTSTKLNNLVDAAAFVAGSSGTTDDATLEVAAGQLRVKTVQTGNLATGSVTTAKLADSSGASDGVTTAKLATGAVTTAKLADLAVTNAKIADATVLAVKIGDNSGTFPIKVQQVTKTTIESIASGTWTDVASLSLAFTRVNVTSKVRIQGVVHVSASGSSITPAFRLVREGTAIGVGTSPGSNRIAASFLAGFDWAGSSTGNATVDFIDDVSAVATNPLTYKIQCYVYSGTAYINRGVTDSDTTQFSRPISTMTLTELA